jgi:hypothetical protein
MIVAKPKQLQPKSGKEKSWFEKIEDFISYLEKFRNFIIAISLLMSGYWISDSVSKASLISNSIEQLVKSGAERDIALIALDSGISPSPSHFFGMYVENCMLGIGERCNDPVFDIAKRLYREGTDHNTRLPIISIMSKRKPNLTQEFIYSIYSETGNLSNSSQQLKSNSSQQSNMPRIVYIQYKSNKTKAEELQKALQEQNISAPGIEQVGKIQKNDIRYANATDKQIAENLRVFLEKKGIKVESLIDLSESGYRVPSGQLEIWLKD